MNTGIILVLLKFTALMSQVSGFFHINYNNSYFSAAESGFRIDKSTGQQPQCNSTAGYESLCL